MWERKLPHFVETERPLQEPEQEEKQIRWYGSHGKFTIRETLRHSVCLFYVDFWPMFSISRVVLLRRGVAPAALRVARLLMGVAADRLRRGAGL